MGFVAFANFATFAVLPLHICGATFGVHSKVFAKAVASLIRTFIGCEPLLGLTTRVLPLLCFFLEGAVERAVAGGLPVFPVVLLLLLAAPDLTVCLLLLVV